MECQRCVTYSVMVPTTRVPGMSTAQPHQRIPYLNVPGTCYLSWVLSCVGVRRVVLQRAMCLLMPVPRERNVKGASHIHGPNYQSARFEYGSTPPKDTLLECTRYLLSLVGAIVCRCTTCYVAACDVLTDTGTA